MNESTRIPPPFNKPIIAILIRRITVSNGIWILRFENFQLEVPNPNSFEVLRFLNTEWINGYSQPIKVEIIHFSNLSAINILKSDPLYNKYLVYQVMNS